MSLINKNPVLSLSTYLVREACGLDDNEPVTLSIGAESVRKLALAALRERDAVRTESQTRCCNCIHSALSHNVDGEERRECKVHCCSCEQYVDGNEY